MWLETSKETTTTRFCAIPATKALSLVLLIVILGVQFHEQSAVWNLLPTTTTTTPPRAPSSPSPETKSSSSLAATATIAASTATTTTATLPRPPPPRSLVNFKSCVKQQRKRPLVTVRTDVQVGMGHRLTQWWFIVHVAIMHGYCLCFDKTIVPKPVWEGIYSSLFHECSTGDTSSDHDDYNVTIIDIDTSLKTFVKPKTPLPEIYEKINETIWESYYDHTTPTNDNNMTTMPSSTQQQLLFKIYPAMNHVWRKSLESEKRGYGDVLQFASHLIEPSLLESVVKPHYLNVYRSQNESCFLFKTVSSRHIFNFAIHLRVGDLIIESKREYWENVLQLLQQLVVSLASSPELPEIHVYFLYYNIDHMKAKRKKLPPLNSTWGIWDGTQQDLPKSHRHLAETCTSLNNNSTTNNTSAPPLYCHWKSGTYGVSMEESIDALLLADGIYMSGSSFSQWLGIFHFGSSPSSINNNNNLRMVAITKELNWHGTSHPSYGTSHATALTHPTNYYHINVDGKLFPEQEAYLNIVGK